MNDITYNIETVAWMREMIVTHNAIKPGAKYYLIGRVTNAGNDHTLAVSESGTGAGRHYCEKHQAVFMISAHCPVCNGLQVQE